MHLQSRQGPGAACAKNPCSPKETCAELDPPGAFLCCATGPGAAECDAKCPKDYKKCSRSCCEHGCMGDGPNQQCAAAKVDDKPTQKQAEPTKAAEPTPNAPTQAAPVQQYTSVVATNVNSSKVQEVVASITTEAKAVTAEVVSTSSSSTTRSSTTSVATSTSSPIPTSSLTLSQSSSRESNTSTSITFKLERPTSSTQTSVPSESTTVVDVNNLIVAPSHASGSGGGLSTGGKAAIGILVPMIAFAGIVAFLIYRRKKNKQLARMSISTSAMPELHHEEYKPVEMAEGNAQSPHELPG